MPIPHERHTIGANPNRLFEDGPGPGLEPVGGEFQPSFETVHPGGGAHLVRLSQLRRLRQFCQLKDIIDFNDN
jgi:hypothetical protein